MTLDELTTAATDGERFTVHGSPGIAWAFVGAETMPDEDSDWTGIFPRTGMALMCMVGDDRIDTIDPEDISILPELDYCHVCGQVGCTHDGLERE